MEITGDSCETISDVICGSVVIFGGLSILFYEPWRCNVEKTRQKRHFLRQDAEEAEESVDLEEEAVTASKGTDKGDTDARMTMKDGSWKRIDQQHSHLELK